MKPFALSFLLGILSIVAVGCSSDSTSPSSISRNAPSSPKDGRIQLVTRYYPGPNRVYRPWPSTAPSYASGFTTQGERSPNGTWLIMCYESEETCFQIGVGGGWVDINEHGSGATPGPGTPYYVEETNGPL